MPETRRLKFIVSYDGRSFAGWQTQANAISIQDTLERAFEKISGRKIPVTGSGRTDAGVHALAQCAHADVPTARFTAERWVTALNGVLPETIRILRADYVTKNFHARFSARGKLYRYRIIVGPIMPPLEVGRAWHLRARIDDTTLRRAIARFLGRHDFASFAANRGKADRQTVRTITSAKVRRRGQVVELEFAGEGFLYKMVRLMVGAAVHCAQGKDTVENLGTRLRRPTRSGTRFVAPAAGLYLVRVSYQTSKSRGKK